MQQDYAQAYQYIAALTGENPETAIIDFRALHDKDKGRDGIPLRGTLPQCWSSVVHYQGEGYGIFCNINALDGRGRKYENIAYIRAQAVDLDNISAAINRDRALSWIIPPSFYVNSSPDKYHVYWPVQPYTGSDYNGVIQRKLRQLFDGDESIVDATRVLRLPGTLHLKGRPYLVQCFAGPGYGNRPQVQTIEAQLTHVTVTDTHSERLPLGHADKAAPSLEWLVRGLWAIDPNRLERLEWLAITAAFKQAGWSLTDEATLRSYWDQWCGYYNTTTAAGVDVVNDTHENDKLWRDITNSQTGWTTILKRSPQFEAEYRFGNSTYSSTPSEPQCVVKYNDKGVPYVEMELPKFDSVFLDANDQMRLFGDCVFVTEIGKMLHKSTITLMNQTTFNVQFGGYRFVTDAEGSVSKNAWESATLSTLWTVDKVHHTRFVPDAAYGELMIDELGRKGVNMYRPFNLVNEPGDISMFLNHMNMMFPDAGDRKILFDYLAHNVKYPGHKIPWAPFIQSAQGVGKGILGNIMTYCMGPMYVFRPKAKQLGDSGAKFNAWMDSKLFLIADEVKCDDQRELLEILKPMISEEQIEMEAKGQDQKLKDNFSNWLFFSNYKYAMPVRRDDRRIAPFFCHIQHKSDKERLGLTNEYFEQYRAWLKSGGYGYIANFFLNYDIERGSIPSTAPETTSLEEAIRLSRGPVERIIFESVQDQLQGFRAGWVSTLAVIKRVKNSGVRIPTIQMVETILNDMGYFSIGRAPDAYFAEDAQIRTQLYHVHPQADLNRFAAEQGYA